MTPFFRQFVFDFFRVGKQQISFLCLRVFPPSQLDEIVANESFLVGRPQAKIFAMFLSRQKQFTYPDTALIIHEKNYSNQYWHLFSAISELETVFFNSVTYLVHTHTGSNSVWDCLCLCVYKKVLEKVEVYVCVHAWLHVWVNECVIVLVGLGEVIKGRSHLSVTGLNLWPDSKLDMSYFPLPVPVSSNMWLQVIFLKCNIYTVKQQPVLSCC